jgi:hypothetical protein
MRACMHYCLFSIPLQSQLPDRAGLEGLEPTGRNTTGGHLPSRRTWWAAGNVKVHPNWPPLSQGWPATPANHGQHRPDAQQSLHDAGSTNGAGLRSHRPEAEHGCCPGAIHQQSFRLSCRATLVGGSSHHRRTKLISRCCLCVRFKFF